MYFRSLSGAFTTTYTVHANISDGTEVYFISDVCFKNGLKWTVNHPNSGKQMDGAIIKETLNFFSQIYILLCHGFQWSGVRNYNYTWTSKPF
jgi:hypothetical protein